jgi:hypothetical protein
MKLIDIRVANDKVHKYTALFQTDHGLKEVKFGGYGYEDFTQTNSNLRKKMYLARHAPRENWDDPTSAGSLSRWLLWNKRTLSASILDFKKRFGV